MKFLNLFFLVFTLSLCDTNLSAQSYKVTFCANYLFNTGNTPSRPGHIWVALSDGESQQAWGFYPAGLKQDSQRKADVDYSYNVTKENYEHALQVVEEFKGRDYDFGSEDCRFFASSIAQAIGLKSPSLGLKSPPEWLGDLVDMN